MGWIRNTSTESPITQLERLMDGPRSSYRPPVPACDCWLTQIDQRRHHAGCSYWASQAEVGK